MEEEKKKGKGLARAQDSGHDEEVEIYAGGKVEDGEEFEVDEEFLEGAEELADDEFVEAEEALKQAAVRGYDPSSCFLDHLLDEFPEEDVEKQRRKNRGFIDMNREAPVAGDQKVQQIRSALEKGVYDYGGDMENIQSHLDFMDAVMDMLLQSPMFIASQLKAKKEKLEDVERDGRRTARRKVDIDELCKAVDETRLLAEEMAGDRSFRKEAVGTMDALFTIARTVFVNSSKYDGAELAKLIGSLNEVCSDRDFLSLAFSKDVYFSYIISYVNSLLREKKEVPAEAVEALNILITVNSRLINAVIMEKSETYAPIIQFLDGMRRKKKI